MGGSSSRALSATKPLAAGDAVAAFGFDLFHPLCDAAENVVVSPLSLFAALGMAAMGAGKGTDAEEQLRWLLRHDVSDAKTTEALSKMMAELASADKLVEMVSANAVFLKESIKPEYVDRVTKTFGATTAPLTEPGPINEWVSGATKGKIAHLVDKVDELDRCFLMNAIYFKGAWTSPFDARDTTKGVFKSSDSETECNMMHRSAKMPFASDSKHCSMVVLPYGETQRFSAIVLLPTKPGNEALNSLIDSLTPAQFKEWLSKLENEKVNLALPRFKVEYGTADMLGPLAKLGLKAVLEPSMFLGMTDSPLVCLDKLLHKTVLEVNEAGSEAAAATAAVMTERAFRVPIEFEVNRPFVFAIVDNTNSMPVFLGKITSPEFN